VRWFATFGLVLALLASPALAAPDANVGFTRLTFVCPSPFEIDFSWPAASNATSYSLQLVGPLDPAANGGVSGTFLRQFGTIEVANGVSGAATITLSGASLPNPLTLQWQVMLSGPHGYTSVVPRQQVALVPAPCGQTTPQDSPYS
jgi:hypothetical protein